MLIMRHAGGFPWLLTVMFLNQNLWGASKGSLGWPQQIVKIIHLVDNFSLKQFLSRDSGLPGRLEQGTGQGVVSALS